MAAAAADPFHLHSVADLISELGHTPLSRVRMHPAPETATEEHLVCVTEAQGCPCELIYGTLVQKPVGYIESEIAAAVIEFIRAYVRRHRLGIVQGEAGLLKLQPGLVRATDVSFVSFEQFAGRKLPNTAVLDGYPDLAVEVLSESNTWEEMQGKIAGYFRAGPRLAWLLDLRSRTVAVYQSAERVVTVDQDGTLARDSVLPGFTLPVADLFRVFSDIEAG